jgi:UDP-N-acetylmuramoyl-tripeptide--D-alanyl-D-alanine ligase
MRRINAEQMTGAVRGKLVAGTGSLFADGISTDSRKVVSGDAFIALRGENFDGHSFAADAVKKGASILIVDRDIGDMGTDVAVIKVDDTLEALQRLAAWYRRLFDIDFVAVTGSTGKTTTKNMIAQVLSQSFSVLKTPGNLNNQIGLPVTVMQLDDGYDIGVVEMGMNSFGEIRRLMSIVKPRVSVVTNIGVSHIEKLGSRENILIAKMEVFDGMADKPVAVVNGDDQLLAAAVGKLDMPVVYYGMNNGDLVADDVELMAEEGIAYTLHTGDKSYKVRVPIPGGHNVYNSLAAIAVGRVFGMDYETIINGLERISHEKMRLAISTTPDKVKVINDAYNASPDSMRSAIALLAQVKGSTKIAVLADMLEMGAFAEEGHRFVGHYVAQNGIDILIAVGDNSRFIADGAIEMGMDPKKVFYFKDKGCAMALLDCIVKERDVVLVKGSRGMRMEEIANRLHERS